MSFILDALRKAESARTTTEPVQAPPSSLGEVAPAHEPSHRKRLLAAVTVSGLTVIAVAAWWLGRETTGPAPNRVTTAAAPSAALPIDTTERKIRPLNREVRRRPPVPTPEAANPPAAPAAGVITPGTVEVSTEPLTAEPVTTAQVAAARPVPAVSSSATEQLPGYDDLVLRQRVSLPPLHLDIHVYAAEPQRRFVFVNNRKYREGERLEEGGRVERITADGVVLEHRGYRFKLLPD